MAEGGEPLAYTKGRGGEIYDVETWEDQGDGGVWIAVAGRGTGKNVEMYKIKGE
jgi:hypothetical protein